jgi:hypothetical protein
MYVSISLRSGIVYAPTMGQMSKGFYRGVEPVAVVAAANAEALREALQATVDRGNPNVPMLKRREWPDPVVLKYAGVKKWSVFERGMMLWGIEGEGGTFLIAGKSKQRDGMWRNDPNRILEFPPGSPVDEVIERMIAILQDAAGKGS